MWRDHRTLTTNTRAIVTLDIEQARPFLKIAPSLELRAFERTADERTSGPADPRIAD
jgi:hypothetical protein